MGKEHWYTTEYPEIKFEKGTSIGEMKKRIWDASEEEIQKILDEYEIGAPSELGKPNCYIQTTPRNKLIEKRKKNDVVLVPIGCTENHGIHSNSGLDTFMVTQICEAVRRKTAKDGCEVSLALPPLNYGGHPYHHIGIAGTVMVSEDVVRETVIGVLAGLWDDGYRKIILVNNHGHKWMLEAGIQEFFKRYQLPALVTLVEWHRSVREFFVPTDRPDSMTTNFVHADEAETSVGLLLFPEMIDMSVCVDAQGVPITLRGHFDNSVDSLARPHTWSEAEGHNYIERFGTPEAVVGYPSRGEARKAKRPVAAICEYLNLMIKEILEDLPAGQIPPFDKVCFRDKEEIEACLKEPMSEGWKSVHELKRIGIY